MSIVSRASSHSSFLPAAKTQSSSDNDSESDSHASVLIVSSVTQVSKDSKVTTELLSSAGSRMSSLSLEDVLQRSGVQDGANVLLLSADESTDDMTAPQQMETIVAVSDLSESSSEQIQDAIDAIQSSSTVVVEVETTNTEQIVTVRAVDIDTVYTQATVQVADQSNSGSSNFLLLKNGWAYANLQSSPLDLPVGPSEQLPGNGWTLWRSTEDGGHELQDALTGLWNRLIGQVVDTSPKSAQDVEGFYKSFSADEQLIYTSTSTTTLQLSADGVFSKTRSAVVTNDMGLFDVSYTINTFSSAEGHSSGFSGGVQFDGVQMATVVDQQSPASIAGDMFGGFRILEDGITLELQFADGSVEKQLFLEVAEGAVFVGKQDFRRYGAASENLLQELLDMLQNSDTDDVWAKALKALASSSALEVKREGQSSADVEDGADSCLEESSKKSLSSARAQSYTRKL